MVLEILFWVLLILSVIPAFVPDSNPYAMKSRHIVLLILIAILGLNAFTKFAR
jgi:hypothetical protein